MNERRELTVHAPAAWLAAVERAGVLVVADGAVVWLASGGRSEASVPPPVGDRARWLDVKAAAAVLGYGTVSFRRLLERHARRSRDGGVEAVVDGIRARKVGRTWRVQLSSEWTSQPRSTRR